MTDESILTFSEDIASQEAPDPLPAGEYPASIAGVEVKTSQNSGNRYLDMTIIIPVDAYPADYDTANNPDGCTIHYRRVVVEDTPRHRYNVRRLCEACGVPASKELNVMEFVGREVVVTVRHDDYNGVTREDISEIKAG